MMTASLPLRPNLGHLKRQAKELLRKHRGRDADVCDALRQLKKFRGSANEDIFKAALALHEAQYAVALSYGFSSWRTLREHVLASPGEPETVEADFVSRKSLWATIDAVASAMFEGGRIPARVRQAVGAFIADRQGKPGSYGTLFAPLEADLHGFRLFTGERLAPGLGARHVLGEEACRCLIKLDCDSPPVQAALEKASSPVLSSLDDHLKRPVAETVSRPRLLAGMFCCMKCSVALWRHVLAAGDSRHDAFMAAAMKSLRAHRKNDGWLCWPFHYTLLMLLDCHLPAATAELRHAAPRCERELKLRISKNNIYSRRRRIVVERVLARC